MHTRRETVCRTRVACRRSLLGLVSLGLCLACRTEPAAQRGAPVASAETKPEPPPARSSSNQRPALDWGGLEVRRTGTLHDHERGGDLLVLLHGFGATYDDLIPLARALAAPQRRFLLPNAPLHAGSGRAWWARRPPEGPHFAPADALPLDPPDQEHHQVRAARQAIQRLLKTAKQEFAPTQIGLIGFSQGAMLALHVGLAAAPLVNKVAALSGVLLKDSLAFLGESAHPSPLVFVAHGREDPVLEFREGRRIPAILLPHAVQTIFYAFDGGHQIPPDVVQHLQSFLLRTTR